MRSLPLATLVVLAVAPIAGAQEPDLSATYQPVADRIIAAAVADSAAWNRLAELSDRFGHRLSGSDNLERALDWIVSQMRADGLDSVWSEPVHVPHWVRGRESVELVAPVGRRLAMLGLGGSVGTPRGGITAEVLVVSSFDDLESRAREARGKIVLFDVPWQGSYGPTVRYRSIGAIAAARAGAVGALLRSVTPYSMRTPHTGQTNYDTTVARIPYAAITVEDAMMLHRMQARGERIVVRLEMEARTLPDAPSRNVIAELRGRERPDEVIVLGGHIDSWDVGQGAMDDGGGSVAAWEAVRLLHRLGLQPRRSIRAVLWTNEENGLRGGRAYRDAHEAELDRHVLAIESDAGVFRPTGFGFGGSDSGFAVVRAVARLLEGIDADSVTRPGGGADIGPLMERGVPGMGLSTAGERYFWYHHSDADTVDKLDPRDMARCVAALAVMAYVVADLEEMLPR